MREQRKVVSIVFADVVGSTALASDRDPEVVRSMMQRYFRRVSEIAATYGGTIEKFAGDAAMIVFGVPTVHDDDAERAVRAALEIRDRANELSVRVGVNSGEAVTALTEDRQFMVSGDVVNLAARLQQGAGAGEVLVGPLTRELTRHVIEYAPHEPISAKGKVAPLIAHLAMRAVTEIPAPTRGIPGLRAPLIGRDREVRLLLDTLARVTGDRRPHLFTVVGTPGIGKSRLIGETTAAITTAGARMLRGRCLPYGRGITYWPFIEMLRQDTGISAADDRDSALHKLDLRLRDLFKDSSESPAVRPRLAAMAGFEVADHAMPDTPAELVDREIGWAVRRYLEAASAAKPLVVIIDDLQWAEAPVVALVEQLAERVSGVPLLVICIARPEFLEKHGAWSAGKPNSITITLDPLSAEETGALISRLLEIDRLPVAIRDQVIERSAGTPLFCEEFAHMLIDEGVVVREGGGWRATSSTVRIHVPHGINAMLAARLDLLPERERAALQAASVVGERFGYDQLRALTEASVADVESDLESLRRRGLVGGGDRPFEGYWFSHILIRDAAYASLSKASRATIHDRLRAALESTTRDPQQICELLAHHAERAFSISLELELEPDVVRDRSRQALKWQLDLADRSRMRHDLTTLRDALQTARAAQSMLLPNEMLEARVHLRLLEAQSLEMRGDYVAASEAVKEAALLAESGDFKLLVAKARLADAWIWYRSGVGTIQDFQQIAARADQATQEAGDPQINIESRQLLAEFQYWVGHLDEYLTINRELLEQARSIGDEVHAARILERLAYVELLQGNLEAMHQHLADAESLAAKLGLRAVALGVLRVRAHECRNSGDLDGAIEMYARLNAQAEATGVTDVQIAALRGMAKALQGQHRYLGMAQALDRAIDLSESTGDQFLRGQLIAFRARAALLLGDRVAADDYIQRSLPLVRDADVYGFAEIYDYYGMILAAEGRDPEAEEALRRSVGAVVGTDWYGVGTELLDLARFLAERGRLAESRQLLEAFKVEKAKRRHLEHDPEILEVQKLIDAGLRET